MLAPKATDMPPFDHIRIGGGDAGLSVAPSRARNLAGLKRLKARCLADAPHKEEPSRFLRLNAQRAEQWLTLIGQDDRPTPEHLEGLTAFDLSDLAECLNAAASRIDREGLGAFIEHRNRELEAA